MRIFYFDEFTTIMLCFLLWPLLQLGAMEITYRIPDEFYSVDNRLFKLYFFEKQGQLYEQVFKVKKWKHLLPDGARYFKRGYQKKHLKDGSKENLEVFVKETCRAEMTHILGFWPFILFGLFIEPIGVVMMLIYALAVNLPCVLVQRYNRIRLVKIINRKNEEGR